VTFNNNPKYGTETQSIETVLTAEQAAAYTMEYTLGDWSATAKADASQAILTYKNGEWAPREATIFLVESAEGVSIVTELPALPLAEGIVVRAANGRGGFGEPAHEGEPTEAIENTAVEAAKAVKAIRDGQVIIVRGEKEYSIFGQEVK
jgi:hypothetical protein